jgi:hypothetical protein
VDLVDEEVNLEVELSLPGFVVLPKLLGQILIPVHHELVSLAIIVVLHELNNNSPYLEQD